ncbi:hypothetical protein M0638_07060 [Roseomonas sp. NAR14]|uniref:Uncharacterized protein n=1 Tax=Roseomonas acroporae TaxID=2937791 RepID=A0A9X1Y545_9PROT|nr:hypothetical protein [Roseomonas acroporae]MCK8784134.1 hypothetical protein [Roseomonas acroporae]
MSLNPLARLFASQPLRRSAKRAEEEDKRDPPKKPDDEDGETTRKVKRRAKQKGDDEDQDDADDEEEREGDAARAARRRERARCAAIFRSPLAAANFDGAMHLAFETTMPARAAIALMSAAASSHAPSPATKRPLAERILASDRMARGEAPPPPSTGLAASIIASAKKARGEG